ncbi:MAG TPA: hypothetical protein VF274_03565 [Alphaproteobacteria bacterium]|jgi:hypothetical protein
MRLVKASVLAVALAAFAAPAFACGGAAKDQHVHTTVTPSGAQSTVVTQTASQPGK